MITIIIIHILLITYFLKPESNKQGGGPRLSRAPAQASLLSNYLPKLIGIIIILIFIIITLIIIFIIMPIKYFSQLVNHFSNLIKIIIIINC